MSQDHGSVGSGLTPLVPSPSLANEPATPSGGGSVLGFIRHLDDKRSVFLGERDGHYFVKFTKGGAETQFRLTPEALKALVGIYQDNYELGGERVWQCVVEYSVAPEGVATTPTADGEARQAKPAGDRTQDLPPGGNSHEG